MSPSEASYYGGRRMAVAREAVDLGGRRLDPADPVAFRRDVLAFLEKNRVAADALVAGSLQMLGLEELREKLGPNWDRIKGSVQKLAEKVIQPKLGKHDLFFAAGDAQFLILFCSLDAEQADRTAKAIATELATLLFGRAPPENTVSARAIVLEVERDDPEALATPAGVVAGVAAAEAKAGDAEAARFAALASSLEIRYWPATRVAKRMVSLYRAEAIGATPGADDRTGAFTAALDRHVLSTVAPRFASRAARGEKALLVVPLHYETVVARSFRDAYADIAFRLGPDARRRLLLEIVDTPPDVSQSRLHQIMTTLGSYVAGVICRFPADFRNIDRLQGLKLFALSLDARPFGTERPSRERFEKLKRFVEMAGRRRLRTMFLNALSTEAAIAAKRAAFDYIDGTGVFPHLPRAGRVLRLK